MKKVQKAFLCCLLLAGVVSVLFGILYRSPKWVESAGLIFDIAGVVQLEISGLFLHFIEKYGDSEKYPHGPPSHITRDIMEDAERPIRAWIHNQIYYEKQTGFWLLVIGFGFQITANWL